MPLVTQFPRRYSRGRPLRRKKGKVRAGQVRHYM